MPEPSKETESEASLGCPRTSSQRTHLSQKGPECPQAQLLLSLSGALWPAIESAKPQPLPDKATQGIPPRASTSLEAYSSLYGHLSSLSAILWLCTVDSPRQEPPYYPTREEADLGAFYSPWFPLSSMSPGLGL